MTRLTWVRHGPTHAKGMVGWRDLPADLSDADLIARLDRALPAEAAVISSDLVRARDTATALQGARVRLPDDADLREFHFGAWDGMVFDTISDRDPMLSRAFWETPGDVAAPGGESWNDLAARVDAAVDRLCDAHAGRDLVVVAHFGVILTQVRRALGCTPYEALAYRIDNFSMTETRHTEGRWQAGRINHLV